MKAHYLLIESCNYKDYPLGGHLSFAKQLIKAFGNELALVGVTTDNETPVGRWTTKIIEGIKYDFFSVKRVYPTAKKGIIPSRIKTYFCVKKYKKRILAYGCNNVIIQTPEIFFNFKNFQNLNICLVLPGLGNPLKISRYSYGKYFATAYEKKFFKAIDQAQLLMAAADKNAINNFIGRSKNSFDKNKLVQFPTRFDDTIFFEKDQNEARKKLGLPNDEIIVVTSGRLNYYKGWKFMIDSFEIFNKEKNNSILIFLGDGEEKNTIMQYISQKGLSNRVILKGSVNHHVLSNYLNAADLFIMGSFAEGWSTSLVEAVACATPICTTNFSSAKELVENEVNGFVLDNRNEKTFAEKMIKSLTLDHEKLRQKAEEIKRLSVSNLKEEFLKLWQPK